MNCQEKTENVIKTELKTEVEEFTKKSAGFLCPTCQAYFLCSDLFVEHVRGHHLNSDQVPGSYLSCSGHESSQGISIFGDNGVKSFNKSLSCKSYKCGSCSQNFCGKSAFIIHKRTHTGEKRHKCGTCSRVCVTKSKLIIHERIHTGEKPYKCDTCSRAFSQKVHLKVHLRTHTGEKPYKCVTCSRAFTTKSALKRHERTHIGEKPYKCGTCLCAFAEKNALILHKKSHFLIKYFYKCDTCFQMFFRVSDLKNHKLICYRDTCTAALSTKTNQSNKDIMTHGQYHRKTPSVDEQHCVNLDNADFDIFPF